ncbi:LysR substrate-binding domain-containing protein [Marinobacterium arenosum]|uniref:LysR substrate-binding domain-containing protein n=1 Tax=Marinobacterium arenosum TaxID=2862496 RepID=UPI001C951254|nr:LysR substrate-binding domain-containing protein [Marinobacterium arenosum]MBY4677344.1 LysR family transcriptional regulator [Marinobacterium arenosum]
MSRWDGLEAFVQVVRLGTLSAAARELQVSTSHISRLINRLEDRLGAQLLVRTTRNVRPTEVGQAYFEQCQQLLAGLTGAEQQVRDYQRSPSGLLRLSCGTVFGERYIAPLVNDFICQHPGLQLDLHLSNRMVDLVQDGYDLAIRMGLLRDSTLVARRLCERREYIVASPDYLARHGEPKTVADLTSHNCLIGSNEYWRIRLDGSVRELRVRGGWRANAGSAILDAALKGIGIAQLPDYYVDGHLASGALQRLLVTAEIDDAAVWAVYPKSRHLSPKVRLLVDYLQQRFAAGLPWQQSSDRENGGSLRVGSHK